ncbi:MAG: hypothetical protein PHW50_01990 [Patescibacteria group bacterium]|nr:hypothetical protein [Patescibacteria group bacterium]
MIEIQPSLLQKVIRGLSSEPAAFLVCNKTNKIIKKRQLCDFIWPISFKKGNLTLGVFDAFYINLFRAHETKFLEQLNSQINPTKVNKIFYRFSDKKENNF